MDFMSAALLIAILLTIVLVIIVIVWLIRPTPQMPRKRVRQNLQDIKKQISEPDNKDL